MDRELWRDDDQGAADRWQNGIGSPEWHRACRAASRRAWRRHPLRSARAALRWRVIKWLDTDA